MSTSPRSLAWRRVSAQLAWPARAQGLRRPARPAGPASGASPWSRPMRSARNASSAQYCRKTWTGRPSAAAPAVRTAAAWSLSSVPEKRTRLSGSSIGGYLVLGRPVGASRPASAVASSGQAPPGGRGGARRTRAHDARRRRSRRGRTGGSGPRGRRARPRRCRPLRITARCCDTLGWLRPSSAARRPTSRGPSARRCRISSRRGWPGSCRTSAWRLVISSMPSSIGRMRICASVPSVTIGSGPGPGRVGPQRPLRRLSGSLGDHGPATGPDQPRLPRRPARHESHPHRHRRPHRRRHRRLPRLRPGAARRRHRAAGPALRLARRPATRGGDRCAGHDRRRGRLDRAGARRWRARRHLDRRRGQRGRLPRARAAGRLRCRDRRGRPDQRRVRLDHPGRGR